MSIYGIGYPTRPATTPAARDTTQGGTKGAAVQPERLRNAAHAPALRPVVAPTTERAAAASLEPPPGTDPELWKILSTEERGYFAKLGAMGPLTYGRAVDASRVPSVRGGRLDVKV
ncbi:MAG TPA: hypothetical protein VEA99_06090 [Gemmatimonadaceae bacterium]|nr:hypothetical protein [Gemmatimonadaceae bacterium]